MSVSAISSSAPVQAQLQTPVHKAPVSQTTEIPKPAYTVSLSSAAQKPVSADVDHDGDSH